MAEKASQNFQFSSRSCASKASKHRPVKVVHIQNPIMVKTTASEFRTVVQFHTGRRKRSSTDHDQRIRMKAPKLEGGSRYNFSPRAAKGEISPMSSDSNNTQGDCNINSQALKDVEAQSEEISDMLNSQIFETLNSVEDGIFVGLFSPHLLYD